MAKDDRHKTIIDVHMLLLRDDRVLMGKRQNTGFHDGDYHLPAGHLEANETVVDALIREAREELGINIHPHVVQLAYILHQCSMESRLGVFFSVPSWDGEPRNIEPEKCSGLEWFAFDNLPDNIVPYARFALLDFARGANFGLYNW